LKETKGHYHWNFDWFGLDLLFVLRYYNSLALASRLATSELVFCCLRLSFLFLIITRLSIDRYAQYSHFKIHSEADYYKLEIDGYEGNAGDSLNDPWYGSNNSPFSTYNRDNDRSSLNCASMLKVSW